MCPRILHSELFNSNSIRCRQSIADHSIEHHLHIAERCSVKFHELEYALIKSIQITNELCLEVNYSSCWKNWAATAASVRPPPAWVCVFVCLPECGHSIVIPFVWLESKWLPALYKIVQWPKCQKSKPKVTCCLPNGMTHLLCVWCRHEELDGSDT